ncbi:MAG: ATP-binding protein [Spirochaetales bacterium]|nr:ATP-binding protein [Spirochaetales bacterium]
MLLAYGASNFTCFKEGIEVSFRLGKGCPVEISKGKNYSNILCVKGANGSGKSNALNVLDFLNKFCCNSFSTKPEEKIEYRTFFNNSAPSFFYAEFSIEKIEYRYDLELKAGKIISEIISRKDKRMTEVIIRKENKIVSRNNDFKELDTIKLRSNASIISTAHQYELESIEDIYQFFAAIVTNEDSVGASALISNFSDVARLYSENNKHFTFTKEIIKRCDLGIKDIVIKETSDEVGNKIFIPYFVHNSGNKDYEIHYNNESSGTKSLFNQLMFYKVVLNFGGILVLDEFDINLHPDILPILTKLFTDESINTEDAQLLFTTHNSKIMDVLGKYRTILVNKEENESYLYRLDELPGDLIRNDRPIEPIYRSGKVGGVPKV